MANKRYTEMQTIEKVLQRVEAVTESGCMIWMGALNDKGYGLVYRNERSLRVHRLVYSYFKGAIPAGLGLDHLCRVRCCVNPDHLEPVTQRVNVLRGVGISAIRARRTHCIYGHPLIDENLRVSRTNQRICVTCRDRRNLARYGKAR